MKKPQPQPVTVQIDRLMVRRLAVEAEAAEPTILKRLRGEPVRGIVADRVDRVLRARGIEPGALREAS